MTDWKMSLLRTAHQTAARIEDRFDALRLEMRERLGRTDPVVIQPYRSFGTKTSLRVRGRVLEDEGIANASDRNTVWQNLMATYRRFESDEVPGVRVRARFAGAEAIGVTDEEGYFDIALEPEEEVAAHRAWHEVDFDLLDSVHEGEPVHALGHVLIPPATATFGVISDVDDTILKTDATSLLQMARLTFLQNAHTRLPFEGVDAFYRALQAGPDARSQNPIFFVSSSPWNLYDLLVDFCEHQSIPRAPFMLRDLGFDKDKFIKSGHHEHKLAQVEQVLSTYPDLPFVLIGDSGQQDPEIYRQVVDDFPSRIRAIYIRDVSIDARDQEVQRIISELGERNVPMLLTPNTWAAADDAAERGLITAISKDEVQEEVEESEEQSEGL